MKMRVGIDVVTPPSVADGGGIAVAAGGDVVYLRGSANGQTLTWNAYLGAWEVGPDELTKIRRLLEEILVRLDGEHGAPKTLDTDKLRQFADAVLQ